jgi:hypothetical protein
MAMKCGRCPSPCPDRVPYCAIWHRSGFVDANASVRGTVADGTGAVVVGATVSLLNTTAGLSRKATADPDGTYEFLEIPAGEGYAVQAMDSGFSRSEQAGIGKIRFLRVCMGRSRHPPVATKPRGRPGSDLQQWARNGRSNHQEAIQITDASLLLLGRHTFKLDGGYGYYIVNLEVGPIRPASLASVGTT